MILNPLRGPIQLSRALLDTFCRFVEPDLGQRDERLLGDWIKRGHRWDHPSMNSFPARLFISRQKQGFWLWSHRGQGTFPV